MLVGYMRVSTSEQNLALQRDALEGAGCERLYEDTCNGSVTERPGLSRALDNLRSTVSVDHLVMSSNWWRGYRRSESASRC